MTRRFTTSEALLDYVQGRLEGLAHTSRMFMPDDIKNELFDVIEIVNKHLKETDKQR